MKVKCEKTDECSYLECAHHGIHNEVEECIDDVCQEFDTCIEPGDLVRIKCIPATDKQISKFSRRENRATFVLEKFRKEFDDLAKRINAECAEVGMKYVRLSGVGIHNGLFDDILKH